MAHGDIDPFYRSIHPDHDSSLEENKAPEQENEDSKALLATVASVQFLLPVLLALVAVVVAGHLSIASASAIAVSCVLVVRAVLWLGVPPQVFAGSD